MFVLAGSGTACFGQVLPEMCGELSNAYGPFDYRQDHYVPAGGDMQPWSEKLYLVEKAHFTPVVQNLVKGQSTHLPGPDLDYTLRAFPNHHRALAVVSRAWERQRVPSPMGLPRPAECYFERAVRFRPTDTIVRMLYAAFLVKGNRIPEATYQLDVASRQAGDNGFTHFNLGMLYLDARAFDKALEQAHRAQALGFARSELAERLRASGHWREPAAAPPPASAPSAASAPEDRVPQ